MFNLSRNSNYFNSVHAEIGDRFNKLRLPRHISALESPTHSQKVRRRLDLDVRQCPLMQPKNSEEASNLAVNILQYQLRDGVSQQKHLENLRSNLKHRLHVARVEANSQLVTMLQEEFRQLNSQS